MAESTPTTMMVAAIDFGTTYSGVAISFCHEYERDPTKIYALLIDPSKQSPKTMTCILIKPDGETCYKFGDEADSYYYGELDEEERKEYYLFKKFKMELYNRTGDDFKDFMIKDEAGRTLSALTVFSLAIRYLKDAVLNHCKDGWLGGLELREISWVLTVPAIWDDRAKAFMREAAEAAGIEKERLMIALEPESASIFCQHIPLVHDQIDISRLVPFKAGMKYVVLDCGGGTVDITAHEVTNNVVPNEDSESKVHFIREIEKVRGNDMGGTKVDQEFTKFLVSITGEDVFQKYQQKYPESYWDLMCKFEEKKRKLKNGNDMMTISTALDTVYEEERKQPLKDHLVSIGSDTKIPSPGKLGLSNTTAKSFFAKSISSIKINLEELFSRPSLADCSTILMVGGFSESPILQESIKEAFPSKTVLCPKEAGLAVLKGAIIFRHNPIAISERISKFTYGLGLSNGEFSPLVKIGDRLEVGKASPKKKFHPFFKEQTQMSIRIYVSPSESPKFITDESCTEINSIKFDIPDTTGGYEREVEIWFEFEGTEFTIKCKDLTTGREETFHVQSWD